MNYFKNKAYLIAFLFSITVAISGFGYGLPSAMGEGEVPDWIKVLASAWADDTISTEEFLNAINFLISNEIIKVPGYVFVDDISCTDLCPPIQTEPEEILCTKVYDPVCGVDGNTYGNECEATKAEVDIDYQGQCQEAEEEEILCPKVYDPVCGVDGNTYGNECEATKAGVEVSHTGLCRAK